MEILCIQRSDDALISFDPNDWFGAPGSHLLIYQLIKILHRIVTCLGIVLFICVYYFFYFFS